METETKIIPAKQFLRTTATGELDFPKTKAILRQAVGGAEHTLVHVLLDFRGATSCAPLAPSQLWSLVQIFEEHPSLRWRRIALLLNGTAPGTKAELFEVCATNRGFHVQVFKDFEKALDWLGHLQPDLHGKSDGSERDEDFS
jgi:hypothetical protein